MDHCDPYIGWEVTPAVTGRLARFRQNVSESCVMAVRKPPAGNLPPLHKAELGFLAGDLRWLVDIKLFDAKSTLGDLVGREAELLEVAVRLAEMALQVEHPVLEPANILEQ